MSEAKSADSAKNAGRSIFVAHILGLSHAGRGENSVEIKTSGPTQLPDAERIDWLRLIRSDHIGPRGIMAQTPQAL